MERKKLKRRLTKRDKGRDEVGRFVEGCKGGPGNPFAARVGELRAALFAETTVNDMRAVVRKLISLAKGGDVAATKVLFDRVLGKIPVDVLFFLNAEFSDEYNPDERFL